MFKITKVKSKYIKLKKNRMRKSFGFFIYSIMKYLKTYKLFENIEVSRDLGYQSTFSDEFLNTIKDICLELTDKDYEVHIHECEYHKESPTRLASGPIYKSISIDVDYPDNETFINVLFSIQDFCKENGFDVDVEIPKEDEFLSVDDFIDYASDGGNFSKLSIIIYQPLPQQ